MLAYSGYCDSCRAKNRDWAKKRKERREAAGQCFRCNNLAEPGKRGCRACLDNAKSYQDGRSEAGLCRACSEPAYRMKLCEDHYEKKLAQGRAQNRKLKAEVMLAYGGQVCNCCGETTFEFLSIDHVNNDGAQHRRELGHSGRTLYGWLKKNQYPPGFQVLCFNCNMAKGLHGYCPHQKVKECPNR